MVGVSQASNRPTNRATDRVEIELLPGEGVWIVQDQGGEVSDRRDVILGA